MRIALIGCVKSKKDGCHRAQDIYISPLFKLRWRYVSNHFDKIFILSAKHGLIEPSRRIRKYDTSLDQISANKRKVWSRKVAKQLQRIISSNEEIYFFCGKKYREFLIGLLSEQKCFVPLEGLGLGQQLQWYKKNL